MICRGVGWHLALLVERHPGATEAATAPSAFDIPRPCRGGGATTTGRGYGASEFMAVFMEDPDWRHDGDDFSMYLSVFTARINWDSNFPVIGLHGYGWPGQLSE